MLGIDGGINFTTDMIETLPIPKFDKGQISLPFVSLVDQILATTKDTDYLSNSTKLAKVKGLKGQIDQMVYEMYGLTPEEVGVVEETFTK